jgi:hypothetical protein
MSDTPPHVEKLYREMLMSRSPAERLKMACDMFDTARALLTAGILREKPHLDPAALRAELFRRMYRSDFTEAELDKLINRIF